MRKYLVPLLFGLGVSVSSAPAFADTSLHGFCWGPTSCSDNGTNTPTSTNPPQFGFAIGGGPTSGTLVLDILVPDNEIGQAPSGGFVIDNSSSVSLGTATKFSTTAWTSGQLDSYLSIAASPTNPIGGFLPSTQALDPAATGFFVFQLNVGTETLISPSSVPGGPEFELTQNLPLGSYIVGFQDTGIKKRDVEQWNATSNSGAILETTDCAGPTGCVTHRPPVLPEPSSIAMLGTALAALGLLFRRKQAA